jgi:hypothetical protein
MKPEQQRIAIAEACGWTGISNWGAGGINGKHPKEPWTEVIPDYLNDLNAMHEAEKKLPDVLFVRYANWIPPCATAEARAEAFLRTLGKWEDAE